MNKPATAAAAASDALEPIPTPMRLQWRRVRYQALPAIMKSLHDAQKSIERAVSNLPDPNYPQR